MAEARPRRRVLLVDDDEMDRFIVGLALASAGYDVSEVDSADGAIRHCVTNLPDALVVDYLMPGMDGLELCRKLRANPAWQSLPIVVLTGLEDQGLADRARAAGADDLVPKSTDQQPLLVQLDWAIRAHSSLP
jgi:CheY-like chemotaxis protein